MESARVQVAGGRVKANGRIVAANTASHPAFSASYDLVTDEAGATKRLSAVRWGVARSIATAWVLTFPMAGIVAAGTYWITAPILP